MKITKMLHPGDTMTSEERMQAVINLQVPDRVPVSPRIYYFAANYAGMVNADLYDPATWNEAIDKCFRELGPWDFVSPELLPRGDRDFRDLSHEDAGARARAFPVTPSASSWRRRSWSSRTTSGS